MTRQERVLGWVNRIRAEHGKRPLKKLPKGERRSPCGCPIARALRPLSQHGWALEVDTDGVWQQPYPYKAEPTIRAPKYVSKFIQDFDNGAFPELEGAPS